MSDLSPAMLAVQQELQALHERNEQLMRVIEFYSEDGNWKRTNTGRRWKLSAVARDKGSRARSVLFGLGE